MLGWKVESIAESNRSSWASVPWNQNAECNALNYNQNAQREYAYTLNRRGSNTGIKLSIPFPDDEARAPKPPALYESRPRQPDGAPASSREASGRPGAAWWPLITQGAREVSGGGESAKLFLAHVGSGLRFTGPGPTPTSDLVHYA